MNDTKKDTGRTKNGRFTKGNKAAAGHTYCDTVAEMRKALYTAVSADDIRKIVEALKDQAIGGDLKAISLLLDRLLGTAQTGIDLLARIEKLEAAAEAEENNGGNKWEA